MAIPAAKGSRFRGKTLYLVSAIDLDQVELPPEIAKTPGLTQLVPSHGNVLRSGAREAVERIAASL